VLDTGQNVVVFKKWTGVFEPRKAGGVVLQAGKAFITWCYCACETSKVNY